MKMDLATIQLLTLILAGINTLALPAILALGKHLWGLNARLLRIEIKLKLDSDTAQGQK